MTNIDHRKQCTSNIGNLHGGHRTVAATASIPSKYQTIVVGNNEKKGFNSGSKRFDWQQIDDSPGPAKYCTVDSILKGNNASFSRKGLGGFVSKVERFPLPTNQECSVGPGQYNPKKNSRPHDFNKAKCTSNFHLPIATKCDSNKFQTPAPNQYNLSGNFKGKVTHDNNLSARAAFMSRTKRGLVGTKSSNSIPAPGTYTICEKWTSINPRVAQAPFKSTTERMLLPKSVMVNPGPGTYDPYDPQYYGIEKNGFTRKHYLCIAAPAMEMPPEMPTPGPGQYDLVNYDGASKDAISSSMFVSTTNRWRDTKRDSNPGPGTYNPERCTKQSFMYNRDEKWI